MISIHEKRVKLRISQTRLAALSGISRFRICLHERGDLSLTRRELDLIDEAIRREADRILSEAQELIDVLPQG